MNICLVSREFRPFRGGGIGTYARTFSSSLAAAGHGVTVLTIAHSDEPDDAREGNLRVVRVPFMDGDDWSRPHGGADEAGRAIFKSHGPFAFLSRQFAHRIRDLEREGAFDAIEFPDTGALGWFTLASVHAGEPVTRAPIIVFAHSPTEWIERLSGTPEPGDYVAGMRQMEVECFRWAHGVVAPSRDMAAWVESRAGLTNGSVFVRVLPVADAKPTERAASDRDGGELRLLFVGRCEMRKGIDTLVRAISLIDHTRTPVRLVIAGADTPGPDGRMILDSLLRAHPRSAERVERLGSLDEVGLARARSACDAAVTPSPSDNFPYACAESMLAGLPMIASAAGGMGEMVRHGVDGLLFAPGDHVALARTIGAVGALGHEERRAMGLSARERIRVMCDPKAIVGQRMDHYRRVGASLMDLRAGTNAPTPETQGGGLLSRLSRMMRNRP